MKCVNLPRNINALIIVTVTLVLMECLATRKSDTKSVDNLTGHKEY